MNSHSLDPAAIFQRTHTYNWKLDPRIAKDYSVVIESIYNTIGRSLQLVHIDANVKSHNFPLKW